MKNFVLFSLLISVFATVSCSKSKTLSEEDLPKNTNVVYTMNNYGQNVELANGQLFTIKLQNTDGVSPGTMEPVYDTANIKYVSHTYDTKSQEWLLKVVKRNTQNMIRVKEWKSSKTVGSTIYIEWGDVFVINLKTK